MGFIEELKTNCDIVQVAEVLNCLPTRRDGNRYQGGNCPTGHDSQGGKCFTIYPETQSGYCFHCGRAWDVIGLVQEVKYFGFLEACDWLSQTYGLPFLETKNMSPEEKGLREARLKKEQTVYAILTESARYYHKALMADKEMKGHLIGHYGLTEETLTIYALGYSKGEGLLEYLQGLGFSIEAITSTGLFVKVAGTWREFFNRRLVFPYWKSGRVVYFIGRKTTRTPDVDWEHGKYKKLLTVNEKRSYVSESVQNNHFYGEDSIRGATSVYVAEGVTDCLAMLQTGYPTISPVTTRFRADDIPYLKKLTKNSNTVYLVPDSENNEAGISGAMDTAVFLENVGKSVYIVTIPRPEGVEKIDATDFLRDHGKEAFDKLIAQAKTPLQLEIDNVAKEELDLIRLSEKLTPIKEKLARVPQDKAMGYLDYMKTSLRLKADFVQGIRKEIKELSKANTEVSGENESLTPSALFPGLVDLVIEKGQIAYLIKDKERLRVDSSFINQAGALLVPPGAEAIPFDLLPADAILAHQNDHNEPLYWDIFNKLKDVSVLPSDKHYHLCTVYTFFTHVSEASPYYPYLWFFGLQERGKSRIVKVIASLSYRGMYTETLNEAYIFRFADLFRGTLALDLYELSERAQKKGSHDLLLGRYERGMKVARVTNPDKGKFKDTQYFIVSGPTVLATNVEIPAKDPLQSRCIRITMPEARGIYKNNSNTDLIELKARLLAFRAQHLGKTLPQVDKPVAGRLGDIMQPLLCVAELLPGEATEALTGLVEGFESDRREAEAESLAGRIAEALYELQWDVESGRLATEKLREKINEGIDEKYRIAPQTIGRELSAMGIKRKKSGGKMEIKFDLKVIEKIWTRFSLSRDNLPNLSNLPDAGWARVSEREIKNGNLPDLPKNQGGKGDNENNLPAGELYKAQVREEREEREITPGKGEQHTFFLPEEVMI